MKVNPFLDTFEWLFDFRYIVLFFWLLLIASILIARSNWSNDPSQRSAHHLTVWAMRVLIGGMWFQASTWKLPLPYSDAFAHWLRQSGEHASFSFLGDLVNQVMIPALPFFGTLIFFLELIIGASLMLGLFTRLFSFIALGQAAFLWLTLYRAPDEWPWNYVFLGLLHLAFLVMAAGRSLGIDAMLCRSSVRRGTEPSGLLRAVS